MFDAITATQLAMGFDQLKLQSISQNIANMNTPGFKRQVIEQMTFNEHLDPLPIQTQAALTQTQNPTDLALSSEGYFQVQSDEGIFYTRRGDFQINAQGELSMPTGEVLLGQGGAIKVPHQNFKITPLGALLIDNHQLDQLILVDFKQPSQLQYKGHGLYQTEESPIPSDNKTKVLQGYLEQSNVKSLDEMMELVKTSRHFEANQRVLRTADNLLATAISQLGEGNV